MYKIGLIGCGNMGSAMLAGILAKNLYKKEEIIVSHLTPEGARRTAETYSVTCVLNNREVAAGARLLILAVKPQFYQEVLEEIRPSLTQEHLLVGIAPGKTMAWIRQTAGVPVKVARIMPNTPAKIGEGMSALCVDEQVTEEQCRTLKAITDSFGRTELIPERLMDAAGAVGGCSPAFVYMMIEAMADAAVLQGTPRPMAYRFAAGTVAGAAGMVIQSGQHPGDLKDMVCSPAGTTIEGVRTLERMGFRGSVIEALTACAEKGKKL